MLARRPAGAAGNAFTGAAARSPAGGRLTANDVLRLQRTVGNRAVHRLLGCARPGAIRRSPAGGCQCGRQDHEDLPPVQRKPAGAGLPERATVTAALQDQGPGRGLDRSVRDFMEPRFGRDFGAVRIHTDTAASRAATSLHALAFTVGRDIFFSEGQYQPQTQAGQSLIAHELTHTIQQSGGTGHEIQRLSWDDVTNAVSSAEDTVKQDAEAAASAVVSGAEAAGEAVASGAHAVAQGAEAAGQAVVSGAEAVASGAAAAGKAVVSGVEAAGQAVVSGAEAAGQAVVSGAEGLLGSAALSGANAIAGLFGGTVTVTPSGGIVITIPDQEIAEVEDETFVLPFGIPTLTLFDAGFKVGTFVIDAWAGTIIGDPSVTMAIGPVRLQNISLVLDPGAGPGAGTYLGTAQLYIGSAISGSGEEAHEAKLQAEGVIPAEPPIPILASAEVGLRAILRLVGKEGFSDTVTVGYAGGSFILREVFDVKLGALANLDHEAFLRVEIEGEEICSVIWPIKSQRLGDAGVEIRVPVTIATGSGKAVTIGTPTAGKFPADAIETDLQDDHEPEHCMGLEELAKFLCDRGKVPPDICAILLPGKGGLVKPPTPACPTPPCPTPLCATPPCPPGPTARPTPVNVRNGPRHAPIDTPSAAGMSIAITISSSSGVDADMAGIQDSEVVGLSSNHTGSWAGVPPMPSNNSGFMPGYPIPDDHHSWGKAQIIDRADNHGGNGSFEKTQLDIYTDAAAGVTAPQAIPASGYIIKRTTTVNGTGISFRTEKRAAAVTVNGYTTTAGPSSAQAEDVVVRP